MSDKIYRINMNELSFKIENIPEEWKALGGRGFTSTVVATEVDPECHPLGPNNKLVFAPGLLSGTIAANSGRNSLGAKSPLTGGIKESNVGGTIAGILSKLGIKALIVEGIPKDDTKFYQLHVTKNHVDFIEVPELVGKDNYFVLDNMLEKYSKKVAVMSIGRPGEMKMVTSNISVKDPVGKLRSYGRGGLGAVMGSKKIKCITVDAQNYREVTIADTAKFKEASKRFTQTIKDNPTTGGGLARLGTAGLVNIINGAGAMPSKNFTNGNTENAESICGETLAETIQERGGKTAHSCHAGCIMQCSQVYNDKDGKYLTSGFEYETIWALGIHLGIKDLDQIAKIDGLMDDLGLDSIETGATLGLAVEAGLIEYGDGEKAYDLIANELAKGTPLGRIIGSGAGNLGKLYGLTRVAVVKNQSMPAYDPRSIKGIGITYATTPMGSDHTAGFTVPTNLFQAGGVADPLKKEGQVDLSRDMQIKTAMVDSMGMCNFIARPMLDGPNCLLALVDMINARFDSNLTVDGWRDSGKTILKTEKVFNVKAGLTNADDRLPEFMRYEPLAPHNTIWDFTGEEIDEFWNF